MHEVVPAHAVAQGAPANASVDMPDLHDTDVWTKLGRAGLSTMASAGERYEIGDILGVGSTGQVFAVLDRNLGQQVAVKALSLEAMRDERNLAGFLDEARTTAALKHPNVLPVLDINVTRGGRPYFSMRKVDGRTLGDCILGFEPRTSAFGDPELFQS
jgi:serine/threonine protein kinase